MRKLLNWMTGHPVWALFLSIVALLGSVHFAANWQSERSWRQYCEAARARGVKLTLAEMEPPPVADAQNFASLPMWKAVFDGTAERPMDLPRPKKSMPTFGNRVKGETMDWPAWQKLFVDAGYVTAVSNAPARDVLQGLEHYAPYFAQWGEWRTRPLCRFPLDYKAGAAMPLPHLGTFQDAARLIALRMRAHLALGDSAAAYEDFREALQAYRVIESEPTLISGLVRISMLAVLWNAVGDGLMNRQWGDAELWQIEADFASVDVWKDRQLALASERGFCNTICEQLFAAPQAERVRQLSGISNSIGSVLNSSIALWLVSKRVIRDNQFRQNRYLDELLAQVDGAGFDPTRPTPSGPEYLNDTFDEYYYFLFRMSAPVYDSVLKRYVYMKTALDQTRLAIALERFRLARGEFPARLDELAPEWIAAVPLDAGSRQPMIYRRSEGGQTFTLYGLGSNGTDEGGAPNPRKSESGQTDIIWFYAPPRSPASSEGK